MSDFLKYRERPRRAVPGMVVGPYPSYRKGFAEELIPFGQLVFQGGATVKGRYRTGQANDTLDNLIGPARISQMTQRPFDDTTEPGYPTDWSFDILLNEKMWFPADTGLMSGNLHYQLVTADGRTKGCVYQTASATNGNSLDITSRFRVFEPEDGDEMALLEIK